jgi:phage gp29-like protein
MLNNLKTMVSNIRMDKYMGVVLPPGYTLELKSSSSGQRQSGTNEIINRWDQRIAITLLADIIFLGSDKSGSFALADVKKSLLAYALESQLLNMANVINQFAIPRLLRLNTFAGYTDYPKAVPGEIETPDMVLLADAMSRFAELGMKFFPQPKLERYINNNFGFPELTEEEIEERDKKIEEENKKQEKIIEENKKKLDISQKIGNNTNSQNNKGTKNLTTRETKPKQTDDKTKFNATYERTGQK